MAAKPKYRVFQQFLSPLIRIWQLLVEPGKRLQDPEKRRRSRLLSSLLVPYIPSFAIMANWSWLAQPFQTFLWGAFIVLCIAYFLNRRGDYALASVLSVVTGSLVPFMMFLLHGVQTSQMAILALVWTAANLITGYLLLNLRGTVLTAVANLAGIVLLPAVTPELSYRDFASVTYFNLTIACQIVIAAMVRQYEWKRLHAQSQALQESEERYRDLFRATSEGILVHENGVILDANGAFETMTGYSLNEIVGTSALRFFTEEYRPVAIANRESTEPYEARCVGKDGKPMWVEIQGKSQIYRGKKVRVVSVRDITERKQSEAQEFELAIEREKVKVLQRFIGDMSHDLRTPLSVIKTSIYLLERLAHDPVKFKQNLDMLQTQTDHLQNVLEDLLSMSRLDKADTSDYRFRWLDVNAPIKEAVDEQQALALRKQIRLRFEGTPDLPPALIDYNEFKRMLKHLILNGLNYTPEGGTVTVQTRADDTHIIIEVQDTGEGIAALDLPHIFDRFFRADKARAAHSGGAGVGLTIARKIVEAHNGTIEAESKLGQGSIFRVYLPQVVKDEIPTTILPHETTTSGL